MPAPAVVAGSAVAIANAIRFGIVVYDIHRRQEERRKNERLDRAKREEAMAYQRAKDSRAALDFVANRLMGDGEQQPDNFRGYYFNPHSLKYDLKE